MQAHLAQADRHIVQAQADIARQRALIQQLMQGGPNTNLPERTLAILEETLAAFEQHRKFILERLNEPP
jgi:hypothetical protein